MLAICHLSDGENAVTLLQRPDLTYYSHKILPSGAIFRSRDFETIEKAINGAKTPFRNGMDIIFYGTFNRLNVSIEVKKVDPDNIMELYPLVEKLDSIGIETEIF